MFEILQHGLSPSAVPTALTSLLMIVFGANVLRHRISRVTLAFAVLAAACSVWLIAFTLMYTTTDAARALLWSRIAYLGVPVIGIGIYHFTIEMLHMYPQRKIAVWIGWALAEFFSITAISTSFLVVRVERFWWGYYPQYRVAVAIPFLAYFFGYLVAALVEIVRVFPAARGVERRRLRLLLIAFAVAYLGCVDYLPKFGISVYPFGYAPIFGFVCIVAVIFRRYDLVALTPSLASQEIISTMADALFVCDGEGRIQFANRAAEAVLGYAPRELVGRSIEELIDDPEGDSSTMNLRVAASKTKERTFLAKNNERVEMMLSIAPVMQHGEATGAVLIGRDIRERRENERQLQSAMDALRDSENRYRLLFEQNAAGVCVTKLDGEIVDCNATFASMLRYERAELIGNKIALLYERPVERAEIEHMLQSAKTLNSIETELRRKSGGSLYVLQNLTLVGDRIHMTVADISDRKRAEEQIEFHAYHDVLTRLPNRKLFTDRLTQNLTHARRSGKPLAVMFVDLDHFKTINDTLGHTAGDELLLEMARRLRSCVREEDTVARLGGDEFTIILSELRHPEDAITVAEKIIAAVQKPLTVGEMSIEVSASIGIALYPVDGNDPESLLRNADSAMYRAKESGRNTYQLCTDEMKGRALQRLSLETRLRRAINEDQLVLHYQPQFSLSEGKVIGAEALVRWNDPERGLVFPGSFIPVAEESRLILPIGDWVLRTACSQMRAWRQSGLNLPRVSVNLSARQFQQADLVESVRRVLEDTRLDATALEIEITETTAMANAEATIETLHALRDLGVSISIDDFGTGYSSLNYLKRFPITCVKIDASFVRDMNRSDGDAAIVSAVIAIARSLRLRVVAEGVETEDQLTALKRRRCDGAQGYYFSRPVAAEALPDAIVERPQLAMVPRLRV
ncbi:MAG TPA: EAL domain-containing protein [Thermoanaerobaculia bacterium]|nr:EAL domain-containing protein [Thermoanaerobaculia bacterium]